MTELDVTIMTVEVMWMAAQPVLVFDFHTLLLPLLLLALPPTPEVRTFCLKH